MNVRADTEVAVLSTRNDLDLAISTWLPGYCAQRTDDLDTVMDVTRRGGVVLIDLGTPRHEEWVSALQDRGFDGPVVFLDPQGEVTLDLRDRVIVPSPPSLSGLLSGFEMARSQQPVQPRRRSAPDEPKRPGRVRRRASATPAVTTQVKRPAAAQEPEAQGVVRARRMRQGRTTHGRAFGGLLRRRAKDAAAQPTTQVTPPSAPALAGSNADAEREFRKLFCASEGQPAVHRIATSQGRVRIQTEEELFAEHPAARSLATALIMPSATPRRQRRARVGG